MVLLLQSLFKGVLHEISDDNDSSLDELYDTSVEVLAKSMTESIKIDWHS